MKLPVSALLQSKLKSIALKRRVSAMQFSYRYFTELCAIGDINEIRFAEGSAIIGLKDGRRYEFAPLEGTASGLFSIPIIGSFEKKETEIVAKLVERGDVCIDVGANFGYYAILMSFAVGERGMVYAFEPLPHTLDILKRNIDLNHSYNVNVDGRALDEASGTKEIFLPDIGISGSFKLHRYKRSFNQFSVKTVSLDEYVDENSISRVNFIKADIEGAELLMLKGARGVLKRFKPILFLEIQERSTKLFGYTPQQLIEMVLSQGYEIFWANEGMLVRVGDVHALPDYNFFFIHKDDFEKHAGLLSH
ncbi:FkbM family methyltransferase [Thiohalomonas denitrificans]|uniref:Methyltransferase, FkbM family n=1 Tax=Thiohalomonas denitrificans TaxID=415747 RepID=A0A1G5QZH0_9GAMM|nr:FkbM family methyltransferase [Thiohalomonas denitrificans]SCZ67245.1 methyltransferase, FkbM family [Thiohalomonas denitrificans]